MPLVTLDEAKAQCRVSHTLEDDLFEIYRQAADQWIKNFLNVENIPQENAVKCAALLIVHDLYNRRGATVDVQTYENKAIESLLWPFRQEIGI